MMMMMMMTTMMMMTMSSYQLHTVGADEDADLHDDELNKYITCTSSPRYDQVRYKKNFRAVILNHDTSQFDSIYDHI